MIGKTLQQVGARIKANRLQRTMAVEDLAQLAGVSPSTVLRTEAGDIGNIKNLFKILEVLGYGHSAEQALLQAIPDPQQSLIVAQKPTAKRGRKRQASKPSAKGINDTSNNTITWPEDQ